MHQNFNQRSPYDDLKIKSLIYRSKHYTIIAHGYPHCMEYRYFDRYN